MDADKEALERALVISLKERRNDLAALLAKHSDHWGLEDPVYRFYHQSFKVFVLQSQTEEIVRLLAGHPAERLRSAAVSLRPEITQT